MPFSGRSAVMTIAQDRPSSTSQKYSNELNLQREVGERGRRQDQHRGAEQAADRARTRGRRRAPISAWPLRVIAYASSVYAADAGVPGIRSRQPGMSPEKIAIAVAVTIAAIAVIGAMKNVTGTSSAVAIVAVSPGTAPTNRPNSDAASITHRLYGSNTI